MDVRSPFFQNIAAVLAGVMFLNPIVAAAAELTVAAGSGAVIGQAGNGVPVVNIAAPNSNGLSHNKFKDYNVGQQGLILNNATERTQATQLGGIILGNSNLNGKAAGMILNEVTGSNASRLQGYTEVAGKSAHVIVANPHGIACDGCGFINTPRVTLSTGTPVIDNGRLDRFDVNGGQIAIEGQGLNANNVDQFDLITRSAKINAELHAKKLNIITGRNEVKAGDLSVTAKALDDSDKPLLAIDSSALGGMYAGAIRLVGTEAGVGVKLAGDMAASAGDIQIDANGRLSMGRSAAAKDLHIAAQQVELNGDTYAAGAARISAQDSLINRQSLATGGNAVLRAGVLTNEGIVEAGVKADNSRIASADLALAAETIRNSGTLIAGRTLEATAHQTLNNQGGTLSAGTTRIDTSALNNQQGRVLGSQQVTVNAAQLDNRDGLLQSRGNAELRGDSLDNRGGDIVALGDLTVAVGTLNNGEQGRITAQGQARLEAEALNNRGGLVSGEQVSVRAADLIDNRDGGLIVSDGALVLNASRLDSSNGGEVSARGDLTADLGSLTQTGGRMIGEAAVSLQLNNGELDNRGGLIHGNGPVSLAGASTLDNRGGEVSSSSSLKVDAEQLDNSQGGRLIAEQTLDAQARQLNNQGGLVSGWQGVTVSGGSLDNSQGGTLSSRNGGLNLELSGHLNNSGEGALVSRGDQQLRAASLDNSGNGLISSEGAIAAELDAALDNGNGGLISAIGELDLQAGTVRNVGGQLGGASDVRVRAESLDNSGGQLTATGTLDLLLGAALLNSGGRLASGRDLLLRAGDVDNRSGRIASQGLLDLFAVSLTNAGGTVGAQVGLTIQATGTLDNSADGLVFSQTDSVTVAAQDIDNRQGALQGQASVLVRTAGAVDNRGGSILSQQGNIDVEAASLNNGNGGVLNSLVGQLKLATSGLFSNVGGTTQAQTLSVQAGRLDNSHGHLSAIGGDTRITTGDLLNVGGGLYARDTVRIEADALDNSAGKVGAQYIDFSLRGILNNTAGLVESASGLTVHSAGLTNDSGALRALGQLESTVIATSGALDNRRGLIESASRDLNLNVGSFLNDGGTVRHVGIGTFGLASSLATSAGGTLITNGALKLDAANWTHSGVIQAQRLELNVGNFTQTASGQLLAGESLVATGGRWINNGLIASDGNLSLNLTAGYSGSGQLTSLGGLTLNAASLDLATSGRIAGGAITSMDIAGLAVNRGRVTSTGDFTLRSATLNNYGTLGGAEEVRIQAGTLINEQGLIFSGGNMALRVDALTNRFADIYSLGALEVSKDDRGAWAAVLENISSTIESVGDMQLLAARMENKKDRFDLSERLVSGDINYQCLDCKGRHYDFYYFVEEVLERNVVSDSPASVISAGGNLQFIGSELGNYYSVISSGEDLSISVDSLVNQGAATSTVKRTTQLRNPVDSERGGVFFSLFEEGGAAFQYAKYNSIYVYNYFDELMGDSGSYFQLVDRNRQKTNKLNPYYSAATYYPLPSIFSTYRVVSSTETSISSGSAADAVIQAGGQVSIDAKSSLANGVVKSNIAHVDGQVRQGETATISRVNTTAIHLNPQLPPELQQRAVNPVALPDFNLPQGENGLFRLSDQSGQSGSGFGTVLPSTGEQHLARAGELPVTSRPATAHRYLIETNPALTDLKQFMSSDYLLGNLGYDTDAAQKRLGDGLYEQRLIREAIVARTGQRYLAGLTSDEAMFRYLMDNALASKNALGLSLGVTLTAEQVAALTHDIVWMEEHEVLGEKVLVPVLYLAQAEGRLAPNGALIQGRDVALISGGDLTNQGTLRASRNLDITAGAITNSGLMQANERLQLLATDSIRNTAGGIIAGRDVSAVALTGDIINERSVTRHDVRFGSQHNIRDFVDSAARIEAANDLSISAGRDVADRGGVLESRGDLVIDAARDVTLTSVEERVSQARGNHYLNEKVTQLGAQVSAGGDIDISAGRDLAVIASQIDAGRDLALNAGGDVLLTSAANEDHFYSRSKKVTRSTDKIVQQSSVVQAGRDIAIAAGEDLTLVASQVKAGNNVALDAEQDINILSAKDESASFYSKKKKGSFGRSSSKQQESYHSTNIASVIEAGNDLTINTSKTEGGGLSIDGGRDVTVIGSQLSAGNDLLVGATGDVAILSGVEEHGSYSKKTKSGFLGMSKSGKSQLKTSATQVASELDAGNDVVIAAGNDIRLRASEAIASNDVELRAGLVTETGDINLVSANDEAYSRSEEYKKKVGLSFSDAAGLAVGTPGFGGDITLASAKKAGREAISSTIVGSQVIADRDATLAAERDINIVGSGVSAGRNVLLDAGRDVNVVAGTERMQTTSWESTKTFGMQQDFDRNGYSTFIGQEALKDKQLNAQQTAAASQITAGLNLDVKAGRDVVQQGSDMSAGYDLNVQAGRNILIDSAGEQSVYERETSQSRTGTTTTVNHNFGNMIDGINGAGKGDNTVSQASGVLKAVGGVSQFLSGPTFDGHVGSTSHSQTVTQSGTGNRGSSLDAGNDVTLTAGNSVGVKGGQLQSGRDIKVSAQDIVLDVARGEQRYEHEQTQAKGGFVGGTTGGFKVGIGGSQGTATQEGSQGTASGTQLQAGRDIVLDARNDLSLIGTQAMAERDIKLNAGNDLLITAAENAQSAEERRRSGGGEVGLTFGQSGIGVYASVNIGRGELDREGGQQQEAYLYAGRNVDMKSGRDTAITGAQIEGENVTGDVGRNLTVSSVPDTGKVSGKEFDASATVTVGYGFSVSGSVGYGQTNGETNWVGNQTSITARDRLDLRTEGHTQIDGALIASNTGNLKLDTDTLGFRDIQGEDKEHSYYLNAGGSYGNGQQDQSQQGKGEAGVNGWSVNGYDYDKEREQIVRATVGAGEIVVRSDAESGKDSTAGLNRDVSKAYEVTKDEEERTDLYVSKTSVEALQNPEATVKQWANALATYDEKAKANLGEVGVGLNGTFNRLERALGRELPAGAKETGGADIAEAALEAMLLNGKSLSEAKALLADESFQKNLLVHIKDLEDISKAGGLTIALQFLDEESGEWIDAGNSKKLIPTQRVLRRLAAINSYLEDNPDAGTALAWGLAAMQGPKAVIQLAAEQALGATELGQRLAQYVEQMQYEFGKDIAETIERKDLYEQEIKDKLLIGGGTLLVDIIAGGVPVGRKAGKSEITVGAKDKYTPNAGSVADMGKFLKQPGFGSQVHPSSQKTKQIFQGQSVYQVTSPVGDYLAKGDKFYLDGMHKNHLEVFDSKGRFKAVLNLDGSYNSAKTSKAISEGRRLAK